MTEPTARSIPEPTETDLSKLPALSEIYKDYSYGHSSLDASRTILALIRLLHHARQENERLREALKAVSDSLADSEQLTRERERAARLEKAGDAMAGSMNRGQPCVCDSKGRCWMHELLFQWEAAKTQA